MFRCEITGANGPQTVEWTGSRHSAARADPGSTNNEFNTVHATQLRLSSAAGTTLHIIFVITHPVVRAVDERSGEFVYSLRSRTPQFKPWVFAEGNCTVYVGEPPDRVKTLTGQRSRKR